MVHGLACSVHRAWIYAGCWKSTKQRENYLRVEAIAGSNSRFFSASQVLLYLSYHAYLGVGTFRSHVTMMILTLCVVCV